MDTSIPQVYYKAHSHLWKAASEEYGVGFKEENFRKHSAGKLNEVLF